MEVSHDDPVIRSCDNRLATHIAVNLNYLLNSGTAEFIYLFPWPGKQMFVNDQFTVSKRYFVGKIVIN